MLRPGPPPGATMLLIRATPASVDEAVLDIAESALDSADTYNVDLPHGSRVALYGVSVLGRPPAVGPSEPLRRFAAAPFYIEASVRDVRAAGFEVLPTGANPDHFDIQLIADRLPDDPLVPLTEVEAAARRLILVCGELRPNPSYAGDS